MTKTKAIQFVNTVHRPYAPFYISLIFGGYNDKSIFSSFFKFSYYLRDVLVIQGNWHYPNYHMLDFGDKVFKKLLQGKKYFVTLKQETLRREKKLNQAVKKDFAGFVQAYMAYMPTLAVYFILDDRIEATVSSLLLKRVGPAKVAELMPHLTSPILDNLDKKSKLYLLKTNDPVKFIKHYGWQDSRYGNISDYPLKKAAQELKELKASGYLKKYQAEKKVIRRAVQEAKKIIRPKQAHLVDIMQFFIYYRTQRTDIMNRVAYQYAPHLKKLATKLGLTYNDLIFCSCDEVLKNKLPTSEIIKARQADFSLVLRSGKLSICTGKESKGLALKYNQENQDRIEQLVGRSAYNGRARGKVKIIRNQNDLAMFKTGDVLVTFMTTPNMIQVMKRAIAFITDEGGITCHAAIIARELKKPCVIGTKVATKVLHDGDLVEIDAERGIVKILKKA